jgi:hypothetical protein
MSTAPTGGVGDVSLFKMPIGTVFRRTWPFIDKKKKKH